MKQWLKDFVHNCIVHPAMMFMPSELATKMHDKNADWAFGQETRYNELEIERKMKG